MALFLAESQFSDVKMLVENTATGKNLYITGPHIMTNNPNRNERIYPKRVVEPAFESYKRDYIDERRSIGEFNHPESRPFPDPKKAAIMTKEMWWEGDNLMGKSQVLTGLGPNSDGVKIAGLLEAGFNLGVSSRGLGDVQSRNGYDEVQPGYEFFAIDAVDRPSGPTCYVNALYESEMSQWIKKDGMWLINEGHRKLQEKTRSELVDEKVLINMFEQFLGNLPQ